jgi:hypothetical protein
MDQSRWQREGAIMSSYSSGTPVRVRPLHEGVGNALRAAFNGAGASSYGLPEDMQSLLRRLR